MLAQLVRPIADSYWVRPGELLAGEYPRNIDIASSQSKLRTILEAGITFFIDLTEPLERGRSLYLPLMRQEAVALDLAVGYQRMPIPDYGIPTYFQMREILDTIEVALEAYHKVYLHCFGGRGRTGTVVGCYLARHGMPGRQALKTIAHWRSDTPDGHFPSPETEAQRYMVMSWQHGC